MSRLAKKLGYLVIANDWEPYSREINLAYVGCNRAPTYDKLSIGGATRLFDYLNALRPVDGYVARHLCPRDDLAFDPAAERLFFTRSNGEKIDAIRAQVAEWERAGQIDDLERAFVLGSLLYAVSYVSNTSGVFKGFHRGWGGATGTALYRIQSSLRLAPPVTYDNGRENRVTALDAQVLAEQLANGTHAVDLAYLDPPYNQHPYGANYHVLNTVALGDAPRVGRTIGSGDKSAIRTDWRTDRRSAYNYRGRALSALVQLLSTIRARYILLSYSTDGIIPVQSVVDAACERGTPDVVTGRYKRYRVSAQRYSARGHTVEFVLLIDTGGPPCPSRARALLDQIWQVGAADELISMGGHHP